MQDLPKPHADSTSKAALYLMRPPRVFSEMTHAPVSPGFFPLTWAYVATGVLVPDWCLAESRRAHLSVAQDTSLPAGAARALVQVPGLPLHVKLPPRCSAHHHVHPLWLTAARLIYRRRCGEEMKGNSHAHVLLSNSHSGPWQTYI